MTKSELHENICKELTILYKSKNADYGDAFTRARELIPNYTAGKLYDKVSRYISVSSKGQANYESVEDTLMDLANYAIMELVELRTEKEALDYTE